MPNPSYPNKRRLILSIVILGLLLAIFCSPYLLKEYVRRSIEVTIEDLSINTGTAAEPKIPNRLENILSKATDFASAIAGNNEFLTNINVKNKSIFSVELVSA